VAGSGTSDIAEKARPNSTSPPVSCRESNAHPLGIDKEVPPNIPVRLLARRSGMKVPIGALKS